MNKIVITALLLFSFAGFAEAQTLEEGKQAIERRQYQKAKGIFNSLIGKEPANAAYFYYMGNVYFENEQYDSAQYFYDKGLKTNAEEPLNYIGIGKVHLANKKTGDAKSSFEKALEMTKKKNPYVMQQIADGYFQTWTMKDLDFVRNIIDNAKIRDRKNPYVYVTSGDVYRLESNSGEGIAEYKKAMEINSKMALAPLRIGELYVKVGNLTEGKKYYDMVMGFDPNYPPLYKALGEYYMAQIEKGVPGSVDNAVSNYQKYLSMVGKSPQERIRYASVLYLSKKYQDAVTELEQAKKSEPGNFMIYRILGYAYYELKDTVNALSSMEKYLGMVPKEKLISSDLATYGKVLSMAGKDSLARITLLKALESDSNNLDLYDLLAAGYSKDKKFAEAAEMMQKKFQFSGTTINTQDYYTMGIYYYQASDFANADSAFKKVTEYYPDYATGYLFRARSNASLDPESTEGLAKPFYEQYIEKAKDQQKYKKEFIEAYSYLAYYYYQKKDNAYAKKYFSLVLELDPSNKGAKDALEYLKSQKK